MTPERSTSWRLQVVFQVSRFDMEAIKISSHIRGGPALWRHPVPTTQEVLRDLESTTLVKEPL